MQLNKNERQWASDYEYDRCHEKQKYNKMNSIVDYPDLGARASWRKANLDLYLKNAQMG